MMKFSQTRLDAAIKLYSSQVGHAPPKEISDFGNPTTAALYRKFPRSHHQVGLGANDGEWIALQLGLKPLVREIVPARVWESMRRRYEDNGFKTTSYPLAINEDWLDGYTCDAKARAHREQRVQLGDHKPEDRYVFRAQADRQENPRLLTYVGRNDASLSTALELDQQLMAYANTNLEQELMAQLGLLLGYPPCCVEAYVSRDRIHRNEETIRQSALATKRFVPLLNNLSLSFFHYIGWFPCRYDCEASVAYARQIDDVLTQTNGKSRENLLKLLSLTRLYWDDRRQLLLLNSRTHGSDSYTDFMTPFALDRNRDSVYFDWVFFCDAGSKLMQGNRWVIRNQRCLIYKDHDVVDDLGPAPLVLDFR